MSGAAFTTPMADIPPLSESGTAAAGGMPMATRADHQHQRLTSAINTTLDANGLATIEFTRTFDAEPVIVFGALGAGTGPVPDFRADLIKTGAFWTGATIYGQRARPLPSLGGILLIGPLIAALSGYTPYEAAAGAKVSVTAIKASN